MSEGDLKKRITALNTGNWLDPSVVYEAYEMAFDVIDEAKKDFEELIPKRNPPDYMSEMWVISEDSFLKVFKKWFGE